ncbi:MAG: transglycosylase SLT domain-containing protein [Nevskiales bacterium]|nr:transglycosylase SLT domain-containing protein [Nevskiales bacterium]
MRWKLLPILLGLWSGVGLAQDDALRERFREALDRAEQSADASADDDALRAYILYPYLQGQRLLTRIDATDDRDDAALDRAVIAFLGAAPPEPIERGVHRAWLLDLARREQWRSFRSHFVDDLGEPALVCHEFQALIEDGEATRIGPALQRFWAEAPQMPQACVPPFDWLKAQGLLTPDIVGKRIRKALDDGNTELAEWLLRMRTDPAAEPMRVWLRLLKDPERELRAVARDPQRGVEPEALLAGYKKLVRRNPDAAVELYAKLAQGSRLSADVLAEMRRLTALGLAWDRRDEAVGWFKRVPEALVDADVHEWRIRAALWAHDLEQASEWLHALPPDMAAEARWSYWRARTLEQLGRERQAQRIYETLAGQNGYYSVLAAWRLGQPYRPRSRGFTEDLIVQSELLEQPDVIRARELHFAQRPLWANAEWRKATRDLDRAQQLQAARLASHWGWHVQAVSMLNALDSLDMLDLSYPDPYAPQIAETAQDLNLPADWIYGLMRQESLFNPRATSPSNAYGLMQLLLPTAREVARRLGQPRPSSDDLYRPEVNIPLGATYLSRMRQRFDGQFAPAVAAYNAGPNAVARWLPEQPMAADAWIENVPYNQTRGYVQKVVWHIAAHRWQTTGEPQALGPLLTPVRQTDQ